VNPDQEPAPTTAPSGLVKAAQPFAAANAVELDAAPSLFGSRKDHRRPTIMAPPNRAEGRAAKAPPEAEHPAHPDAAESRLGDRVSGPRRASPGRGRVAEKKSEEHPRA